MDSNQAVSPTKRGLQQGMPTSKQRNAYERRLANATQAIYWAQTAAEDIGDEGAAEDLSKARQHLQAMLEESARNKMHRAAQQTLT